MGTYKQPIVEAGTIATASSYSAVTTGGTSYAGRNIIDFISTCFAVYDDSAAGKTQIKISSSPSDSPTLVGTGTTITAGTGLTGGGDLNADRTIALASIAADTILSNPTASSAAPTANSLSTVLDRTTSVQNSVIYRGPTTWAGLTALSDDLPLRKKSGALAFGTLLATSALTAASSSTIIGRSSAGGGNVEEISIGSGLLMSSSTVYTDPLIDGGSF